VAQRPAGTTTSLSSGGGTRLTLLAARRQRRPDRGERRLRTVETIGGFGPETSDGFGPAGQNGGEAAKARTVVAAQSASDPRCRGDA
jgi:hypothetical protein